MQRTIVPNSTAIPNFLLDFVIPQLPGPEAKCLLYICRRTFGFGKQADRISLSQFVEGVRRRNAGKTLDFGTGLSRPAVVAALKSLEALGLIAVNKVEEGKTYQLKLSLNLKANPGSIKEVVAGLRKGVRISKSRKLKQKRMFGPVRKSVDKTVNSLQGVVNAVNQQGLTRLTST